MRQVKYYEWHQEKDRVKIYVGEALFHEFGVDYEDHEIGIGNFSTAIIELTNGTIKSVPVEMIEFTDHWK